ncbi:Peptidase M28 domain containing protein [Trichuris trichiura]|uniref:BOS complex subunit NCLN n=1 Tax=Trichuris trichiura TaxID=36087 RepID=A0A077ZEF2_TRITR|nr:Peptidase M28 domain containing protein [Trichuris trichiura]
MLEDIAEFIRSQYAVCVLLLSFVVTSSYALVPSRSASETETFTVFRLPQFDLHGNHYGTRGRRVHGEVTSTLSSSSGVRRCLLIWWQNLPVDFIPELISSNAVAIIVVIPADLRSLTYEERKSFLEMEQTLISSSTSMPIYIAIDSPLVRKILKLASRKDAQPRAKSFGAIYSLFFGKSYKLVSKVQQLVAPAYYSLETIVGRLSAFDQREHVSTIAIVAHYDTLGLAPSRAFGFDSNGTGVILLLELLRIFSRLYQNSNTRAKYNLIFILSGGGKMNFLGSKHWIEEFAEKRGRSASGSSSIEFALCLDSILGGGSNLYMHVSKTQKGSSPVARFQQKLNESAALHGVPLDIVQKKVNLADDRLSWEHEAFNIRRMHAFTISGFQSPHDPMRHSILDLWQPNSTETLVPKFLTVISGLFRYIYNCKDACSNAFVSEDSIRAQIDLWQEYFELHPRSQQVLVDLMKSPVGLALVHFVELYSDETTISRAQTDAKNPEFVIYGGVVDTILAHQYNFLPPPLLLFLIFRTRTALFDLIMSLIIFAYLFALHAVVTYISRCHWVAASSQNRLKAL